MNSENDLRLIEIIASAARDSELYKSLVEDPIGTFANGGCLLPTDVCEVHLNTPNHFNVVVPSKQLQEEHQLHQLSTDSTLQELGRYIITKSHSCQVTRDALANNAVDALRKAGGHLPEAMTITVFFNTDAVTHVVVPWIAKDDTELVLRDEELVGIAGGSSTSSVTNVGVGAEAVVAVAEAANVATTVSVVAEAYVIIVAAIVFD